MKLAKSPAKTPSLCLQTSFFVEKLFIFGKKVLFTKKNFLHLHPLKWGND